jgi:ABC-2 type transport system permease protein
MSRVRAVMTREFLSTVRRRSYLIVTFGMPFFAALYLGVFTVVPVFVMARGEAARKDAGLVDLAGVVRWEPAAGGPAPGTAAGEAAALAERLESEWGSARAARGLLERAVAPVRLRPFATREAALAALRSGELERVYVIPPDYLDTGGVETYRRSDAGLSVGRPRSARAVARLLSRSLLAGRLDERERDRVEEPLAPGASREWSVAPDGGLTPVDRAERAARLAIPGVFAILLLMSLMTSAGYLLQGVSEEKESRVIEVILSSVRPDQLLFGKLLGLGAAGLLQLAVWVTVTSMATGVLAAAALAFLDLGLFVTCFTFFVLGFLLLGTLMTGTGALGTNARESQQLAAIWSVLTILPPAVTWMSILEHPNGWLARVLGWFPLTAPITMMMRLATGRVPAWDTALAIAALAGGIYVSLRVTAALFRLGLLMYGKRPTLGEIARQLRRD